MNTQGKYEFQVQQICLTVLGLTVQQLYQVCAGYLQYPHSTSLSVDIAQLDFPSVTICNSNVVRYSEVHRLPAGIQDFLEDYAPATNFSFDPNLSRSEQTVRRRKRRQATASSINVSAHGLMGGGANSQMDADAVLRAEFRELMGYLPRDFRASVGHDLDAMLITCSFNGYMCNADDFSLFLSDTYGNCYTYNSAKKRDTPLVSQNSGSEAGLIIELMIEKYHYVPGLSENTGVQMVIHQFDSFPTLSYDTSIGVSPGTQTNVALRLETTDRLGVPYGHCGDTHNYGQYFNLTYTLAGCTATCTDRLIAQDCGCVRPGYTEYYPGDMMGSLPRCNDSNDNCTNMWMGNVQKIGAANICGCWQDCSDIRYTTTVSAVSWPDENLYYSLVDEACLLVDLPQCLYLRNASGQLEQKSILSDNFVTIQVFYESLNYLTIKEQPVYSIESFLSSIGGTLGLYAGATALNVVELLDMLVQLVWERCKAKTEPK